MESDRERIPIPKSGDLQRDRKVRCTMCKDYFLKSEMYRQGIGGVCSETCFKALMDKARSKRERRAVNRERHYRSYGRRIAPSVREVVKERDNYQCRMCGETTVQLHHILYRSEGGPDVAWNLIALCHEHHQLMHSSKKKWQPVLRWVLYCNYFLDEFYDVTTMMRLVRQHRLAPGFEEDERVGDEDGLVAD